ncbi:hypothetical protein L873DRAFT_1804587 [Choiromyces venosus 120613-1]|uniref:G-patch domain-containing protein n=1 Tax=Choiromyces venosus 120613-1 TaxID=1336337 RepID=A0A3N4JRA1_9PEZI|nr:hypothetical protein L873DRAFT_1804587 [Choiromyces venosus 120613-1]
MSLKRNAPLDLSPPSSPSSPLPKRPQKKPSPFPSSSSSSPSSSSYKPPPPAPTEEEEEDDYMNMTFADPTPRGPESYSERLKRKQRMAEASQPKSKAELARIEKQKRDEALAKNLFSDENASTNKGFQMMKKMGFMPGSALGLQKEQADPINKKEKGDDDSDEVGKKKNERLEPLRVTPKYDRGGIGLDTALEEKIKAELPTADTMKEKQLSPEEYRERVRAEAEESRMESQFRGAQKVCEKFEDASGSSGGSLMRSIPLKNIPVFWRGLVKAREATERERKMKYEMLQSLGLPMYNREHEMDHEDKVGLGFTPGKIRNVDAMVDEGDDDDGVEDEELAEFQALHVAERLKRIVEYLRDKHRYCFWCKYQYPDEQMEGCPGLDEDLHG